MTSLVDKISKHYYSIHCSDVNFLVGVVKSVSDKEWRSTTEPLAIHIQETADRCAYEGHFDAKGQQTLWSRAWISLAMDIIAITKAMIVKPTPEMIELCRHCAVTLREKGAYPEQGKTAIATVNKLKHANSVPTDDVVIYAKLIRYSISDLLPVQFHRVDTERSIKSNRSIESKKDSLSSLHSQGIDWKSRDFLTAESESLFKLLESQLLPGFKLLKTEESEEAKARLDSRLSSQVEISNRS